ncbi:type IX secretion system anionic LPS delivery protein PorZ [Flavobacterium davisii]|uniref:T9SS type A sorting domain-containing protein n=1 Tax=Flavobacterium columnare TaxID=996 RepID=A0A8G0P3V0_9FLAO|nr:two-component regulator propeller domain-containing protein [Flavobacterium davisii]QYS88155.1 T9SS type A sorting domain-containing protein [Flavobacterium davisii]
MKNWAAFLFILLNFSYVFTQEANPWKGYYSYNAVKDLQLVENKIVIAADNAYFLSNLDTNQSEKKSTIEGLSGDPITQIHYSPTYNKTIVGHSNGLVIIVNETDGSMFYLKGIEDKPNILASKKRINHFEEYKGKVYISTGYGVTVLDMNNSQFGDTFFIGTGGSEQEIISTTIVNDTIYAIVKSNGLYAAKLSNPFLIDFNQWKIIQPGSWFNLKPTKTKKILVSETGAIHELKEDNSISYITSVLQNPKDINYNEDKLIITSSNYVDIFDENGTSIKQLIWGDQFKSFFTSSSFRNNKIYTGTESNGLYSIDLNTPQLITNLTPSCPEKNRFFRIKAVNDVLWVVFGGYSKQYNPYQYCCGGPSRSGISIYSNEKWTNLDYKDLLEARALSSIAFNPKNKNEVFIGSFFSGLLKLDNFIATNLYNKENSPLKDELIPNVVLLNTPNFDSNGDLWMTSSRAENALFSLDKNNKWKSYSIKDISVKPKEDNFSSMKIDKNGTKWLGTLQTGVIGFNEKLNKNIVINHIKGKGSLPDSDVRSLALDNNNQLWIGTFNGLRYLPNVNSFLTDTTLDTKQIILLEDGTAQELFYQSNILDIEVDGANNKWVSVEESGVFLISPDGQQTKLHFTKENSPLPSNIVDDIEIDQTTGKVYFATNNGTVSYQSLATAGTKDYSNTYIYPNPYRPEHKGMVKITGLKDKSNVKITDIEGNLVFESISQGGTMEWDTLSFAKTKVSSGVYVVLVSDEEGEDTVVKKLLIIR